MLRDVNFENIPLEKGDKETENRLTEVYIMFEKEPEEKSKLTNSNTEEENQEEVSEEIENIAEKNTDKQKNSSESEEQIIRKSSREGKRSD